MRVACALAGAGAIAILVVGLNDNLSAESRAMCVTIGLATASAIAVYIGTTRAERNKTAAEQEQHFAALRVELEALAAFVRDEMRKSAREQREDRDDIKLRLESLTGALMEQTGELRLAQAATSRETLAICEEVAELAAAVKSQASGAPTMEALAASVKDQLREEIEERLAQFAVDVFRTQDSRNVVPLTRPGNAVS